MLSYHFLCICLLLAILITSDASFLKPHSSILRSFHKYCKTVAVGAVFLHPFQSVHAARMIGEIPTSGFIFKDTLKVQEFEGMSYLCSVLYYCTNDDV